MTSRSKFGFKQFASSTNPLVYKPPATRKYLNHGFYVGQKVYYNNPWDGGSKTFGVVVDKENGISSEKHPVWCHWQGNTYPSYMPKSAVHAAEDSE